MNEKEYLKIAEDYAYESPYDNMMRTVYARQNTPENVERIAENKLRDKIAKNISSWANNFHSDNSSNYEKSDFLNLLKNKGLADARTREAGKAYLGKMLKSGAESAHEGINTLKNIDHSTSIPEQLKGAAGVVGHKLLNSANNFKDDLSAGWNHERDWSSNPVTQAGSSINNAWNSVANSDLVKNTSGTMNDLYNKASPYIDSIKQAASPYIDSLKAKASGISDFVANKWNSINPEDRVILKNVAGPVGLGLGAAGLGYGLYKAFSNPEKPKAPQKPQNIKPVNSNSHFMSPAYPKIGGNLNTSGQNGGAPKSWITTKSGKKIPIFK